MIYGESDGKFDLGDYILFYGQSPDVWTYDSLSSVFNHQKHNYSDYTYYFINIANDFGKRVALQSSNYINYDSEVNSFDDFQFQEKENINFIKSGREWYGEIFDVTTNYNLNFNFPDINSNENASIKTKVAARSTTLSSFTVNTGSNQFNINVNSVLIYYASDYASEAEGEIYFKPNSSNVNINISYTKPNPASIGWLNYIELNVRRNLIYRGTSILFRDKNSLGNNKFAKFNISNATSNLSVWDVTLAYNATEMKTSFSGSVLSFINNSDMLKDYIVFDKNGVFSIPEFVEITSNQNLHAITNVDYIIVTYKDFESEAIRLGEFHKNKDNLNYVVVTPQEIYNEFSSGSQDISAIRDFVKFLYDKEPDTNKTPRYLLLLGDASYDYKNYTPNNTNFVPSFQTLNSYSPTNSIVSDDFYGLLDYNEGNELSGIVDIGIGRFPVQTIQEAKNMVNKVIRYTNPDEINGDKIKGLGDWRNIVCFIADDQDYNLHVDQSDNIAETVKHDNKNINIDKIFLDSYKQESAPGGEFYPDAKIDITNRFNRGALIINYTGHGGEKGLSHERVVEVSDINSWKNYYNMPLLITATCEFTRFDDPSRTSAGEYVFLNNNGGGIALLTTTRLAFSTTNEYINKNFYKYVFNKNNNEYLRLGDIIKLTKQASGSSFSYKNFTLIGDPAMKLAYPKYNVATDSINANYIDDLDTISALEKIKIKGHLTDANSNILTDFNGTIYPTIYDKPTNAKTLANDKDSYNKEFEVTKSILFKGKASVSNGYFEFEFIVPKDINYSFGNGKISYYAENNINDATGYFENIIIGGISDSELNDKIGPVIKLYMDNLKFVSGGMTNQNPQLIALFCDSSGINMVGNGIGHDITAILDNETSKSIILNDYFEADLNSYASGSLRYRLSELEEGKHNIKVKAWDINNNSKIEEIDFIVASSAKIALQHVFNYPNPFTTNTKFMFDHNKPSDVLTVQIQIFTITGRLIKTISSIINTTGTREDSIEWNGLDEYGNNIGRGVYIYRLNVKASDNTSANKIEKLVILK